MINNFKNKKIDNKQRYLRYDDVFMSDYSTKHHSNVKPNDMFQNQSNSNYSGRFNKNNCHNNSDFDDELECDDYNDRSPGYSPFKNNLMDEKMLKYQKRRLPNLQRYTSNSHKDMYSEFNKSYWDDEDYRPQRGYSSAVLGKIWQKFIITFASILSLICLSWIAYNWNNGPSKRSSEPLIIEPELPSFKILPENPGGTDVSYKDKTVYNMVGNNGMSPINTDERLLPPQEEVITRHEASTRSDIEEYSIIDDKTYYIKISAGKSREILKDEAKLLKKRYAVLLSDKSCTVKRVSNSSGEQKHAVLIGPFESQDSAIETAKNIGKQCYVISVRE